VFGIISRTDRSVSSAGTLTSRFVNINYLRRGIFAGADTDGCQEVGIREIRSRDMRASKRVLYHGENSCCGAWGRG